MQHLCHQLLLYTSIDLEDKRQNEKHLICAHWIFLTECSAKYSQLNWWWYAAYCISTFITYVTASKRQEMCGATTYVELNDPQQGDEQKVKGHKQAEGSPNIWDALPLFRFIRLNAGRKGSGVNRARTPHTAAALAGHLSLIQSCHSIHVPLSGEFDSVVMTSSEETHR